MNDFAGFGFAAGEVRGSRAWKVDTQGRLRGIVHEKIWRPGENTAQCLATSGTTGGSVSFAGGTLMAGGGAGGSAARSWTSAVTTASARYLGGVRGTPYGPAGNVASGQYATCPCGCGTAVEMQQCTGMDPECTCGFYGYQEGSNDYYAPLTTGSNSKGPVGGVFRGYGKVILGTRGFRAEKAEILALYVDAEALRQSANRVTDSLIRLRLEQNYKVPMFDDYLQMLQEFPPDPPEHDDDFWSEAS